MPECLSKCPTSKLSQTFGQMLQDPCVQILLVANEHTTPQLKYANGKQSSQLCCFMFFVVRQDAHITVSTTPCRSSKVRDREAASIIDCHRVLHAVKYDCASLYSANCSSRSVGRAQCGPEYCFNITVLF